MTQSYRPNSEKYEQDELFLKMQSTLFETVGDRTAYYKLDVRKNKRLLLQLLGEKCVKCGHDDYRTLQIDHKSGGGNKDFKVRGKGVGYYRYYLRNPDEAKEKLQVLCANCNMIKKFENQEYFTRDARDLG